MSRIYSRRKKQGRTYIPSFKKFPLGGIYSEFLSHEIDPWSLSYRRVIPVAYGAGAECQNGQSFAPHESDCGKFYQCGGQGTFEERVCAPGLHWNQKSSICDWPASAGCDASGANEVAPAAGGANPWAPLPVQPVEAENEIESTPPPDVEISDTGKFVVCCELLLFNYKDN